MVLYQIGALAAIAQSEGVRLRHVKAHGALYNMAAKDRALADAIARAVAAFDPISDPLRAAGLGAHSSGRRVRASVAAEGFAGSRVRAGRLADAAVAARTPSSTMSEAVVRRAVRMAIDGRVTADRRLRDVDARGHHLHARRHAGRAGADARAARRARARGRRDCPRSAGPPPVTALFGWWRAGRRGPPRARRRRPRLDARLVRRHALRAPASRRSRRSSGSRRPPAARWARSRSSPPRPAESVFGWIADRFGRTRALMASVLIYSMFTAACGLAHDVRAVRRLPHLPRHRHGGRVGERRGAGIGDVVRRAPRQSARRSCRAAGRSAMALAAAVNYARAAALGLARGVLRRHPARVPDDLGPPQRARAGDLAARAREPPRRPRTLRRLFRASWRRSRSR